ncbi:MAG: PilZ domain-containing protein [Candidatus Omnitrophota bacterium]
MWQEKRINRRVTVSLPINYEVLDREKNIDSTICKNISENGIKLVLKKFYSPKTKFLIKVDLEGINKIIETVAESVWSFNMHFSNLYYNGLHFDHINAPDRNALKEYLMMKEITSSGT